MNLLIKAPISAALDEQEATIKKEKHEQYEAS